jgi:DNA-binding XRE family transcriptional regulator
MAKAKRSKPKKTLAERLAQVRSDRSQRQFARELGVFQQNVNRYENGATPTADFLIALAMKEAVSLDWLLLGKGKMYGSRHIARPATAKQIREAAGVTASDAAIAERVFSRSRR